jgi:mannosyl-3-phosphoglycerate phosphatase family protein
MKASAPKLIVSTDLDGTLLDHYDYSWEAARPALDRLKALGIPVILNTSKTYAEVIALQSALGTREAFAVENGSALYLPMAQFDWIAGDKPVPGINRVEDHLQIVFGAPRGAIIDFIHRLRQDYGWHFEGFSDWSVKQIIAKTGLDPASAEKAAEKLFSEPIVWNDSKQNLDQFSERIMHKQFSLLKGGRFYHVQGNTDKSRPLLWMQQHYLESTGHSPKLVSLGDSNNDIEMLKCADYPVCVRSPVGDYPEFNTNKTIIKTNGYGPVGWNEAINDILERTGA